jgi:hypothetical protein
VDRIEQRPLLRVEVIPADAMVVVRGGPNSVSKLQRHAQRTAQFWDLDGEPLFGVSVFCAFDDIGPASLERILESMNTYPVIHLCTAGELQSAGFALLPTGTRPHLTVRTHDDSLAEMELLLAVFGLPRENERRGNPKGTRR